MSTKPKLRAAPTAEMLAGQQEAAAKLLALEKWTEEPNNPPAGGVAATLALPTAKPATQTKVTAAAPKLPWHEDSAQEGGISFNFKLPRTLALKLKFLGETTYGESMTSIVAHSLEPRIAAMLKERGLK